MEKKPNPFKTPEEDLQKNFEKLSIIKSSKESQNFDEDLDLLNECVAKSRNKLNISVDEKEELDNLDDEAIEKEFNEFMKNISKDNTADQFLNEISKIMEKGVGQQDPNFLNSFDDGNFDNFSKNLLYQFVNKDVIYEPLKEAKKKIEELVQNKKNDKNLKVNNEKLKLINDIITLLEIENSNDKIKEEVICKFEELNDKGGLPEEIVKNCMKENPDLENFQKFTNGKACQIF